MVGVLAVLAVWAPRSVREGKLINLNVLPATHNNNNNNNSNNHLFFIVQPLRQNLLDSSKFQMSLLSPLSLSFFRYKEYSNCCSETKDIQCTCLNEIIYKVSISPTFYARLFRAKVSHKAFLHLHFRFELFLAQEYWRKCAQKMLVKLTKGWYNVMTKQ
jgi:hypothetical protein